MSIKDFLNEATNKLKDNNIDDASIKAKELLAYLLKKDKQFLVINADKPIDTEVADLYDNSINKIINGVPLQYITHNQEFMKLNFYVDSNVLIPQPDTEILVEETINIIKSNNFFNKEIKVLDLCTGSGAIAVSISKYTNANVYASDISENALEIAQKNAKLNNAEIKFILSDMFNNIKEQFDVIVSNPPYIESNVIKTLPKDVQSEPILALDGGKDGLNFYRKIADNAYNYLSENSFICMEIGYNQKNDVIEILNKTNKYKNIKTVKDLSGNDRCIIANKRS